jgi:hypothetical protein
MRAAELQRAKSRTGLAVRDHRLLDEGLIGERWE